jgi:hypothetical protein
MPEYLRVTDQFRLMFTGAILLAVVIALPGGLMTAWARWRSVARPAPGTPEIPKV